MTALMAGLGLAAAACTGTPGTGTTAASPAGSPTTVAVASTTGSTRSVTTSAPASAAAGSSTAELTMGAVHQLPAGVAPGLSGLAPGPTADTFYAVDDKVGTSQVVVIRPDGSVAGEIDVSGMSARNAEALGAAPCGSRHCLYIADIGDNAAAREDVVIYRLTDPAVGRTAEPAVWRYTYPDGPHNAEAFFPLTDGTLVIVTKPARRKDGTVAPHRVYRGKPGGGALTSVTTFSPPEPRRPLQSLLVGNVVTDAAYDGKRVLLLTYDQVIEYRAPTPDADPATFPRWPHTALPDPPMIQTEAIAVTDCGYLVGSEEGPGGTRSAVAQVC